MSGPIVNPLDGPPDPGVPFAPTAGQRGSGFRDGPFPLGPPPSATVGP